MKRLLAAFLLLVSCKASTPHSPDLGPALTLPAHRIVTLAPSLTEIFVAMGAADRVVGVTRFDDAPEVAGAARIGGYGDPDTEAVLRVKPDLIVCQPAGGSRGAVEALAGGGIPVVVLPLTTLADVENAMRRIGELVGLPDKANGLIHQLQAARQQARSAAAHRSRRPRVAVLVSLDPLIAAGPGSFIHEMLEDAGADDAIERSVEPYPHVPVESFIRKKPDAFLLALMPGEKHSVQPVPGVESPGIGLKSPGFMHPGPRVVDALHELSGVLDSLASGSAR